MFLCRAVSWHARPGMVKTDCHATNLIDYPLKRVIKLLHIVLLVLLEVQRQYMRLLG